MTGRSARDVELSIGYNAGDISRMKLGRNRPRVELLFLLEDELGLSPTTLWAEYEVFRAAWQAGREELRNVAVRAIEKKLEEGATEVLRDALRDEEKPEPSVANRRVRELLESA